MQVKQDLIIDRINRSKPYRGRHGPEYVFTPTRTSMSQLLQMDVISTTRAYHFITIWWILLTLAYIYGPTLRYGLRLTLRHKTRGDSCLHTGSYACITRVKAIVMRDTVWRWDFEAHQTVSQLKHVVAEADDNELRILGALFDVVCYNWHILEVCTHQCISSEDLLSNWSQIGRMKYSAGLWIVADIITLVAQSHKTWDTLTFRKGFN